MTFRELVRIAVLAVTLTTMHFPAAAQSNAAEANPEAVHISQTYGIPVLNGRLLLPGTFQNQNLKGVFEPIAQGWDYYYDSFRRRTDDPTQMVEFMMRAPQIMQQVLQQKTSLRPDQIFDVLNQRQRNGAATPRDPSQIVARLRQQLNQFEWRAVSETMVGHYLAIRHDPLAETVPVTLLTPLRLGNYDFDRKAYQFNFQSGNRLPGLQYNWVEMDMGDGKSVRSLVGGLPMDEARAQTLYQALQNTVYGPGAMFLGVEATLPVAQSPDPYARDSGDFVIQRVIFALDPALTQEIYVHDVTEIQRQLEEQKIAREQAEQRAKEELLRQLAQGEESGYDRDARMQTFETAGLRIGSPPPKGFGAKRYDAFRPGPIPAFNAFFHVEVTGGQIAYFTDDGTDTGDLIFFARVFTTEGLTGDAVAEAATTKYGAPNARQSNALFWYPTSVPEDRHQNCRLNLSNVALGNGRLQNGRWTRQPVHIDINARFADCGVVAALNTFVSSSSQPKFAVADTTWLSEALDTARAEMAAEVKAKQEQAQEQIEF